MAHFITLGNVYYEADVKVSETDIAVPARPSANHDWDFNTSAWVYTAPPAVQYPTSMIIQDQATGEPVKIVVKNGEVFAGGINEEAP